MKVWLFILACVLFHLSSYAQKKGGDPLGMPISNTMADTAKINLLLKNMPQIWMGNVDSAVMLCRQAVMIARQGKLIAHEAKSLCYLAVGLGFQVKKKDSAWLCIEQAFAITRQNKLLEDEILCFWALSQTYVYAWQKPDSAIIFAKQGMALADEYKLTLPKIGLLWSTINGNRLLKDWGEALRYCLEGASLSQEMKSVRNEKLFIDFASYVISLASPDTALLIGGNAIEWARKRQQIKYEGIFRMGIANSYENSANYPEALRVLLTIVEETKKQDDKTIEVLALDKIGEIYRQQNDYRQSLVFYLQQMELQISTNDSMVMYTYDKIGNNYAKLKMPDSAVYYARKSYSSASKTGVGYVPGTILNDLGELYFEIGIDSIALIYFRQSLPDILSDPYDHLNRCITYTGMAKLLAKKGDRDSSYYYASLALPAAQEARSLQYIIETASIMSAYFKDANRLDSAFHYQGIAAEAKELLFNQEKTKEIQKISFNELLREQQVLQAETKYRNKIRSYFLIAALGLVLLIVGILYRNNQNKTKAYKLIEKQREETERQKEKAENALIELKSAQQQLIQSEKMASLGELTAGIAHEIQNPLNFVNNFSDLNKELISELKEEMKKGNIEEVNAIADNIEANEEKINHHGKRADTIVKGMLQHSRSSSGQKEPTNINVLADEYLRLAYHGLRAKDKSFNATLKTDFDESIGKINMIPQDIGRVILNLITNAFYAVAEKKKNTPQDYEPTITISTKLLKPPSGGLGALVSVSDNGNGIPQRVLEKIFQPFFTTKPTGEGTGLGLSLAYDIVKAHGGELKVESTEKEGTTFDVTLPI